MSDSGGTLRALFDAAGGFAFKWSSYFDVYERTLTRFVDREITFVEVGAGAGGSLLMWKAFFKNARIIGIDIDPAAQALARHGVEIFIGDQASETFWKEFYATVGPVDVVLDDGGHSNAEQIVTAAHALRHVRDRGVIIVEDVHASYMREFLNPARSSFINFAKYLVDCVNSRSPEVAAKRSYRDIVSSVEFHESIVIIHVDRSRSQEPTLVETRGPDLASSSPEPATTMRDRLRPVLRIPIVGPLASRGVKWWDRRTMDRQLARFFE